MDRSWMSFVCTAILFIGVCGGAEYRYASFRQNARTVLSYSPNVRHSRVRPTCQEIPVLKLTGNTLIANYKKITGKWYGYLTYSPDVERTTMPANFVTCLQDINKAANPYEPFVFQQTLYGYFQPSKFFTSAKLITALPDSNTYQISNPRCRYPPENSHECLSNAMIVDTDYHSYLLIYECQLADIQVNSCLYPTYILYTRERSSQFSKEKITWLGEIINRNIPSACADARDFMAYEWKDNAPECQNPVTCFNGCP
ncbi:uncharacterized protein LOC129594807 isoform X2 [Paramacrobiotus metropolitanus]|uniref:uncharacterized protein LOC129594807 isoform X2 n=1 Tax=Paramacrobiotus metropolitanus TaxID=2943436 RepID=UPI0024457976|nr:uncharacterized protein LOC129594807 isoform X2 [Paramacrobiotus metropolitanus]